MTLLDKLVNESGLLQQRHPTFVGRRPFASTHVSRSRTAASSSSSSCPSGSSRLCFGRTATTGSPEKQAENMKVAEAAADLVPPRLAPIDAKRREEVLIPPVAEPGPLPTPTAPISPRSARCVGQADAKRDGVLPDHLSAGASTAFEKAARYGEGNGWVLVLKNAVAMQQDADLLPTLVGLREAAAKWKLGQLVALPKTSHRPTGSHFPGRRSCYQATCRPFEE